MFSAKIIADSIGEHGHRLTSFVITFPRYILAEFNTHRMFSRNSASSRAIPFKKLWDSVMDNPFIPMAWQKDHSGMQGTEYFTTEDFGKDSQIEYREAFKRLWLEARNDACQKAYMLNGLGLTKQLCNRLLEPFMWHTCIVTATELENFFALRCPRYQCNANTFFRSKKDFLRACATLDLDEDPWDCPDIDDTLAWLKINKGAGEIHIMEIAEMMWDAMHERKPYKLEPGEWHIPFGDKIDAAMLLDLTQPTTSADENHNRIIDFIIKVATTRCAQISYVIADAADKPMDYPKMISRHDKLAADGHWSPFEHPGRNMNNSEYHNWSKNIIVKHEDLDHYIATHPSATYDIGKHIDEGVVIEEFGWCGNFRGFIQYRKLFAKENIVSRKTI